MSGLPVWLSDTLCRLASGGSFAVRQLYSDDEEVLFEAARPILLNGIEEVVSRPDLGDRAIFLTLAPIGEALRRPENELWREFEIAQPRILGALLDAAVHGLRTLGRVHLDRLPRMADFALWSHSHLRAYNDGQSDNVDRERVRPIAFVCRDRSRRVLEWHPRDKKPAGARWSAAPGTDVPAHLGHRDHILA